MAKQNTSTYSNPFITTGGSYENPRLGIVDYGGFSKGLEKGIKPGMEFMVEQELEEEVKKEERKLDASEIKEIDLISGDYYDKDKMFVPGKFSIDNMKNTLTGFRDELLDKNTSDERKKEIRGSYSSLVAANSSLTHVLNVDSDKLAFSQGASNLDELFVEQGTTLEDFRNSYNSGKAYPTTKDGVGGYMVNGKFIDFQNKINVDTINGKMNLRSDKVVNTAAVNFGASSAYKNPPTVTREYQGLTGDKLSTFNSKYTTILKEYGVTASTNAETEANLYAVNNPGMLPGIIQDMRSGKFLTEEERKMLNAIEPKHNRFNKDTIEADAFMLFKSARDQGIDMTKEEAIQQVQDLHQDFKDSLAQKYLKNEFLKETPGYKVDGETGIAEIYDERKDTKQALNKVEPSGGGGGGPSPDPSAPRYVELFDGLSDGLISMANLNAGTPTGIPFGAAKQKLYDVEVGKITTLLNAAVTAEDKKSGGVSFKTRQQSLDLFNSRLNDDGEFVLGDDSTLNVQQTAILLEQIENPNAVIFQFDKVGNMTPHNFENATVKTLGNLVYSNLSDSKAKVYDSVFYNQARNALSLENNANQSLVMLGERVKNTNSFEDANVISGFVSMRTQDKFAFLNATKKKQGNPLFNSLSSEEQADYMLSLNTQ